MSCCCVCLFVCLRVRGGFFSCAAEMCCLMCFCCFCLRAVMFVCLCVTVVCVFVCVVF